MASERHPDLDDADFLEVCEVRNVLTAERVALANLNNAVGEFEKIL